MMDRDSGKIPSIDDLNANYTWTQKGQKLSGKRKEGGEIYTPDELAMAAIMFGGVGLSNMSPRGDNETIEIDSWSAAQALIDAGLSIEAPIEAGKKKSWFGR